MDFKIEVTVALMQVKCLGVASGQKGHPIRKQNIGSFL
jgi:hypothetical protein